MVEMEPIVLVTGLPGAGKTLFAIDLLRKCRAEGLRCYNFNVNELDPEIAEPWEGPIDRWTDLPEKSVLVVDEAHGVFPVRPVNAQNPPHIAALAEIRHKGIRIILIDQDPSTLDRFVKRRVGSHYHLVNRTGFDRARVFSNRGCVDNPRAGGAWSVGESDLWKYPKELFNKYKSASVHIKKRRIPRMMWVLAAAVLLTAAGIWWTFSSFSFGVDHDDDLTEVVDPAAPPFLGAGQFQQTGDQLAGQLFSNRHVGYETAEDWLQAHTPLVEGVPWSAPIFASRQPTTNPDLYCVIAGDLDSWNSSCRCYSEQLTPVVVERPLCQKLARHGVYNPYRGSMPPGGPGSTSAPAQGRAVAVATPARPALAAHVP